MILCQEGYQAHNLIEAGLTDGAISGVILSPRYHAPEQLTAEGRAFSDRGAFVMVDPCFHFLLSNEDDVGQLTRYPYFRSGMTRGSFSGSAVRGFVEQVLDIQRAAGASRLLAPTLTLTSPSDWVSQVVVGMFEEAAQQIVSGDPPLVCTLVISEALLVSDEGVDELLDLITILPCEGFYVICARSNHDTMWCRSGSETQLSNLMYLTNALSLNGYVVTLGYSDLYAALLGPAGVTNAATGWFKSQRSYCTGRAGFGRQPRKAYASAPMLSWVFLDPDLNIAREARLLDRFLSGTPQDELIRSREYDRWGREAQVLQLWNTMGTLYDRINQGEPRGMERAIEAVEQATESLRELRNRGLVFESDFAHLRSWGRSLGLYLTRLE